jgi:hypothetical protein
MAYYPFMNENEPVFRVQGPDQKVYGPATASQIREWIAQGRINAQTLAQSGEGSSWKPLGEMPEFSSALKPDLPPGASATTSQPAAPVAAPPTSGLAITSLVLGILGLFTCGITALFGLICGIVAMNKISKSNGQMGGRGIAIGGTVVSAACLLIVLIVTLFGALALPGLASAKQKAQTINCVNNLKLLALAVKMYSADNADRLPPAATWCDSIQPYAGSPRVFQCPSDDQSQRCTYAMNARLDGMNENKMAPSTVLLFEASGGWNVSGGASLLLNPSRHPRIYLVAFVDGSVQQVPESRLSSLRWDP